MTLLREFFLGENMKRLVATRKLLEVEPGRRDLTVELEEAGAAGVANGGGHGPGEEGQHLGEVHERGDGA